MFSLRTGLNLLMSKLSRMSNSLRIIGRDNRKVIGGDHVIHFENVASRQRNVSKAFVSFVVIYPVMAIHVRIFSWALIFIFGYAFLQCNGNYMIHPAQVKLQIT